MSPRVGPPPAAGESTYEPVAEGLVEVITRKPEPVVKPQQYWRDQTKPEGQFQWTVVVRDGEDKGKEMKFWTGDSIGRHPKNKLVKVLKALDPEFDIDVAYPDIEAFYERVTGKAMRVIVEHVQKPDKEDPTVMRTFSQVSDTFMKSLKPELDVTEQLTAMGATQVDGPREGEPL
jgi:hypothetical protein